MAEKKYRVLIPLTRGAFVPEGVISYRDAGLFDAAGLSNWTDNLTDYLRSTLKPGQHATWFIKVQTVEGRQGDA